MSYHSFIIQKSDTICTNKFYYLSIKTDKIACDWVILNKKKYKQSHTIMQVCMDKLVKFVYVTIIFKVSLFIYSYLYSFFMDRDIII